MARLLRAPGLPRHAPSAVAWLLSAGSGARARRGWRHCAAHTLLAAAVGRQHTYELSPLSLPAQALGINDDSLGFVLATVFGLIFFAFAQWQSYQDDDDDFFDTYDSRRGDRELSNRNRV